MSSNVDAGGLEALLELVACPLTGGALTLEGDPSEGTLVSPEGARYPIIGGVPRLLPPDLLGPFLRGSYPARLTADPALAKQVEHAPDPEAVILETLVSYSHQHVEMADEAHLVDDWTQTWKRFQPGVELTEFAGKAVLEVGSGEGRHAWLVGGHARITVGLDLSRGVELARQRDPRPTTFFVQGDLRRPPFKKGAFDALYSNGVIHHTPDPRASFESVAALVRPGGRFYIWVYGLDGMRWTYRLSHLTWLRPVSNRLPRAGQLALASGLTVAVEAGLWAPGRVLRKVGLGSLAERLPYQDAADRDWTYKVRRMFDRINPPITHYPSRDELAAWTAPFEGVEILNAEGQGWSFRGTIPPAA